MVLALVPIGAVWFRGMALKIDRKALRELREQNCWTLRGFAKAAEVTHGYLSRIENGLAADPSPATVRLLAETLGVDPAAITGDRKAYAAALKAANRSPKALRDKTLAA